jgi:hypothetical protein
MSSLGLEETGAIELAPASAGPATSHLSVPSTFTPLRRHGWSHLPAALRHTILILLGAAMLMWTAAMNGRPSLFYDTAFYYSQAQYLAEALHLVPEDPALADDLTSLPDEPGEPNVSATLDGARSPIYGLFIFGLVRMGGLWLAAAGQTLAVAYTLYTMFKAAAPKARDVTFLVWMAALSALTQLPYFTTYVMPDIFGGVAGAASSTLLVYWDRLSIRTRSVLGVILAFALAAHKANLLTTLGVTILVGGLLTVMGARLRTLWARGGAVIAAGAVALTLGSLAFIPIDHRAGEHVRNPPFLMARIMADGPGYKYLQYACTHGQRYALCQFADQPDVDSDSLLWSPDFSIGMFGVSDYPTRLQIENEEMRFVLGALAYDPLGAVASAIKNTLLQLTMIHVRSPLADPAIFMRDEYWLQTNLPRLIPDSAACKHWGSCASRLAPVSLFALHDAVTVIAAAVTAWLLLWIIKRPGCWSHMQRSWRLGGLESGEETARVLNLILLTLLTLTLNAAICGSLSAPVSRYQARMVWLMPAAMGLGLIVLRPPLPAFVKRCLPRQVFVYLQKLKLIREGA